MTFGYSFNIWVPLLAFPTAGTYGAPRWQHGWPISFVFWLLLFVGFIAAIVMSKRGFVPTSHPPSFDDSTDHAQQKEGPPRKRRRWA